MAIRIGVGGEFFDRLREEKCYYVDKTELIYELVNSGNTVSLFTRPRRFGKTLMMSMLESFFDIRRDSRDLFEGLNIARHTDFCSKWMNRYPVLFVTFKDAEGLTFENAYGMLKAIISDICIKHNYLAASSMVSRPDTEVFERLMFKTAVDEEIKNSLHTLLRMMHDHFGRRVILLIDEYDVPLAKAGERKEAGERYYPQMMEVIRGILSTALKSNEYLKFAVVTGCLKIARESIFTGANNFASYSVLDDEFSQYFGFRQEEVKKLLAAADREEKCGICKEWYDGYHFGNSALYCPWDVVSYVAALMKRRDAQPGNYWVNTSGNGILREFVEHTDYDVSDKFEILLNGGTIMQKVSDELTYGNLYETEENLWSVLLMTGYLTKADPEENGQTVSLKIPNAEVAGIFENAVVQLFKDTLDKSRQKQLMSALWDGDEDTATRLISDFLWDTISYHDYHEDYYHAFLTGISVGLAYGVKSNPEQGLGRTDITVTDRKKRRAIIIEAKKSTSEDRMEKDCVEALAQIEKNRYVDGLKGYTSVMCYGVAFFQKGARVKGLIAKYNTLSE